MKYAMRSQVLTLVRLSRKASRIFRQASQKTTLTSLTGLAVALLKNIKTKNKKLSHSSLPVYVFHFHFISFIRFQHNKRRE